MLILTKKNKEVKYWGRKELSSQLSSPQVLVRQEEPCSKRPMASKEEATRLEFDSD
jgi:hypothetical protein